MVPRACGPSRRELSRWSSYPPRGAPCASRKLARGSWPRSVSARFAHTTNCFLCLASLGHLRILLSSGPLLGRWQKTKKEYFHCFLSSLVGVRSRCSVPVRCTPVLIICHLCDTGFEYKPSATPVYGSHKQHYDHSFGKLVRPQGSGHGRRACQKRTAVGNDTLNLRIQGGAEYRASGHHCFAKTAPREIDVFL